MLRIIFLFTVLSFLFVGFACQPATQLNSNVAVNNTANANAANVPPEFSTAPIAPSTNTTPGIPPANAGVVLPKGATPTPGIPDPRTLNKPRKPGATPTPGIPDPETIRRQMQGLQSPNVNGTPAPGDNMMRSIKKGVRTPHPQ